MKKYQSGRCPDCPYKVRLTKDGSIGSHMLWIGGSRRYCNGWGKTPLPPKD